jgi:hypothetical protein
MPQYPIANYVPDSFDPSVVTEAMMEQIHALNREMIAAGVRKFACGISPAANAKTLRAQPGGKALVTDGPYTETKEDMADFGHWNAPISMRRWRGRRRAPSPAMSSARFASFFSSPTQRERRNSLAARDFAIRGAGFGQEIQ